MPERQEIDSPDTATYSVEQDLYDGGDPTAAFIATVHSVVGGSVANIWIRSNSQNERILPGRFLSHGPTEQMLLGEAIRLVTEKKSFLESDVHLNLGAKGLYFVTKALVSQDSEQQTHQR